MPGRNPLHQGSIRIRRERPNFLESPPLVLIRALLIAFVALGATGSTAAPTKDFDRYPARAVFKGEHAPLRLRDAHSRRFASALADASVDFSGHYILAEIECG